VKKAEVMRVNFVLICAITSGTIQLRSSIEDFFAQRVAQNSEQIRFPSRDSANRAYGGLSRYFNENSVAHIKDIRPFLGGNSATVFSFVYQSKNYVARLLSDATSVKMFRAERDAHLLAYRIGIAPELYYADEYERMLIMEFIVGKNLHDVSFDSYDQYKNIIIQCAKTLREFHKINIAASHNNKHFVNIKWYQKSKMIHAIAHECDQYFEYFQNVMLIKQLKSRFSGLVDLILRASTHMKALTHNDIHCGNILLDVSRQKVFVIDWSEAGIDNPFNDILRFIALFQPAYEYRNDFYASYFGRAMSLYERALVRLMENFSRIWLLVRTINGDQAVQRMMCNKKWWESLQPAHTMQWYSRKFFLEPSRAQEPRVVCQQVKAGLQEALRYLSSGQYSADKRVLLKH